MGNKGWEKFLIFYLLVAIFHSMTAMPFWFINERLIWVFYILGFGLFLTQYKVAGQFVNKRIRISFFLTIIVLYCANGNFFGYLSQICPILPIIVFFLLKREKQVCVYEVAKKTLGWVVGISLFGWIFYLIGINGLWFPQNYQGYLFENHLLYVVDMRQISAFARFSSIFVEPGYFGCLLAIILYIEKYDFSKRIVRVFIIALFFTFSLGGWALTAIGYAIHSINQRKVSRIVGSVIILVSFIAFGFLYKGGDNIIYDRVLSRTQYDTTSGTIVGDNRTNYTFNEWFLNDFLNSSDVVFGSQKIYDEMHRGFTGTEANVGWRAYVIHYGFFGLALYFIFMLSLSRFYKPTFLVNGLLILELLNFWQTEHQFKAAFVLIFYFAGISILSPSLISSRESYTNARGIRT